MATTLEQIAEVCSVSRTNVIGLVIPRAAATIFSEPFFPRIIQGISEACTNRGYLVMLAMVTAEMEHNFYRRILQSRQVDAVIMLSSDVNDPILPLLMQDRIPLVLISRHPYFQDLCWVDADNRNGARAAVDHLLELGHRRIATITGKTNMACGADRRDGYKQALLEAGLQIQPELIVESDWTQEGGYLAMRRLLVLPERPTGVFAASDAMAIGGLHAIHEAGLRVPDDISIVGFDDLPIASFASPPLTTIHQPIVELGTIAAELMMDLLERPARGPVQVQVPAKLIVRSSSGPVSRHGTLQP